MCFYLPVKKTTIYQCVSLKDAGKRLKMLLIQFLIGLKESIQADETINDEVKSQWQVDENHGFYDSQMKYCDLFRSICYTFPIC